MLATVTGLLAAFAPALRAARLDPVVAILADPVVRLCGVRKAYNVGLPNETEVLHGISTPSRPTPCSSCCAA